ncbi:Uncharacterized membrane protein YckC, RDD family [Filimonas lacunae]|uniref:Uncharacterized membrane protein YckC, RDD family n=1 Tax=Filimonas lacunae TaxID=477680 RepID=A0A173MER0_9BACT|nr:RDD family protein [Filimonas lacunae]BAV06074.1 hypothetical protein FLA_2089 [Filimonas lacunae]SIT24544.1 Uncharacterized membrane protein YckC, RDD family [Filimonas lacunae]
MQKITVPTAFNIELEFETAELLNRFWALLFDFFVMGAYVLAVIIIPLSNASERGETFKDSLTVLQILLFIPVLTYSLLCEVFLNGQTLGKKVARIKVISETGGKPQLHQFFIRWLTRWITYAFPFTIVDLVSYLSTKKNQRLGDVAAGTMVIKTSLSSSLSTTVFQEVADNYQPRYQSALQLSDRDMNTIKTALVNYRIGKASLQRIDRIADTIRTALHIQEYEDNIYFLETLLRDYNHLSNQS